MSTVAARPALAAAPAARSMDWAPWAILASDVVSLELAFALGLAVRRLLAPLFVTLIGPQQYIAVAVAMLLLPLVHYQLGLYPGYLLGPVERLRRRSLSTLAVFGGLVAWDTLVARGVLSRGVLLATFAFALVLPPLTETLVRAALIRRDRWGIRAIILGAGESGESIARTLRRDPQLGLKPIAFLDDSPSKWHAFIEGIPVAGPLARARDFEDFAEVAIVAMGDVKAANSPPKAPHFPPTFEDLQFPRVIVVPEIATLASLWVTARDLNGCLGLEIKKNLLIRRNTALKRLMDQVIALPLFLLSLPVMALAALWIKLSSPGPAFYRQEREGLDGRRLSVWKLRTMYLDGERLLDGWLAVHPEDRVKWNRYFKLRHDPRVLPLIGRLLRRTSLDELPQLWMILKGEMSLVGPRPFPDYHLQYFSADFRALRTRVLPGLTGLWQVSARGDGDVEVQQTLDTYYIRNWSPWLDLYILARTVAAVLLARGAY
jgi:Undecaprenyl-phosphate galactose phosphotransferase WbaP